ncbi:MAG: DUF2269 family protein [Pseudomonadota bacterium]
MRKIVKIIHTLAACGLIGGLGCYMIVLVSAPQDTLEDYADLRQTIAALSNLVLLPSLGAALISGLISMVVHRPFIDMGWVWIKALLGILTFEGVLAIIGAKAGQAAKVSAKIVDGELPPEAIDRLVATEWLSLWVIAAISVAQVVLGIWRPRLVRPPQRSASRAAPEKTETVDGSGPGGGVAKSADQ